MAIFEAGMAVSGMSVAIRARRCGLFCCRGDLKWPCGGLNHCHGDHIKKTRSALSEATENLKILIERK
ncbi:hypothetical protein [Alkalicoccus urumqiensis]|uniref:hypothetical protein n=1 Tax=Alkalicoccus urumqiensis TaxID=1548213 RepID=UPI00115C1FB1|nr:hypothetical protein [Alkalicoccus urumqiensis]